MSAIAFIVIYASALGTGWLIGAIGVGGVLLVPLLVLVGGMDVAAATPVASFSFLFTGLAGAVAYARHGRLSRSSLQWLSLGVLPGAVAGAVTNVALPATALTTAVAIVLGVAAVRSLLQMGSVEQAPRGSPPRATLVAIGTVVGFGSALTGTGGPVLLIPLMLLAGGSVISAIAAGQPIQVPIAVAATAGFLSLGVLDWRLGIGLGVVQALGTFGGARFSDRAPVAVLHRLVTVALTVSAAVFVGKAVIG